MSNVGSLLTCYIYGLICNATYHLQYGQVVPSDIFSDMARGRLLSPAIGHSYQCWSHASLSGARDHHLSSSTETYQSTRRLNCGSPLPLPGVLPVAKPRPHHDN